MDQILRGGTVGVVACCNSNSDGHPALSHLMYKSSSLKFKKGQRERQHLVPCLSNIILISTAYPAHVILCGSRSLC